MNERELEDLLRSLLEGEPVRFEEPDVDPEYAVTRVNSFEEAGVFTRDRGLIITTGDGAEFQVSIVRSG